MRLCVRVCACGLFHRGVSTWAAPPRLAPHRIAPARKVLPNAACTYCRGNTRVHHRFISRLKEAFICVGDSVHDASNEAVVLGELRDMRHLVANTAMSRDSHKMISQKIIFKLWISLDESVEAK